MAIVRKPRGADRADGPLVVRPSIDRDTPRWPIVGGIAVVGLVAGWLLPRACGLKFSDTPEEGQAAAAPSAEPSSSNDAPVVAPSDAGVVAPAVDAGPEQAGSGTSVLVGKSMLMHCQDPPATELKPSKCGEHGLDPVLVPKIEQLATCPAVANVSGKLSLTVDLNFKTQALKVAAGKGSSTNKGGKRDDKAIEPLLACVRTSLKEALVPVEGAPAKEHARYVLSYAVTITSQAGGGAAPAASVEKEKSASGAATVQVDTAIVRDAPSTSGQPIGRLSRGTKVTTVGTSGNWFHIKFGENEAQEGWVFRTNIGR